VSLHAIADPALVGRISGPLLDRIDIHIDVPAVKFRELTGNTSPDAEKLDRDTRPGTQRSAGQRDVLPVKKIFPTPR